MCTYTGDEQDITVKTKWAQKNDERSDLYLCVVLSRLRGGMVSKQGDVVFDVVCVCVVLMWWCVFCFDVMCVCGCGVCVCFL